MVVLKHLGDKIPPLYLSFSVVLLFLLTAPLFTNFAMLFLITSARRQQGWARFQWGIGCDKVVIRALLLAVTVKRSNSLLPSAERPFHSILLEKSNFCAFLQTRIGCSFQANQPYDLEKEGIAASTQSAALWQSMLGSHSYWRQYDNDVLWCN